MCLNLALDAMVWAQEFQRSLAGTSPVCDDAKAWLNMIQP